MNKNKINLYFLNSQINTINQALINLQCIIGSENIENLEALENRPQIYNPNINQNAQQTRDIFPSFYIKIYQLLKIKNDFNNNQENIDLDFNNTPNRLPRYSEKIINHYRELILTRVAKNMLNEHSCILKLYVNKILILILISIIILGNFKIIQEYKAQKNNLSYLDNNTLNLSKKFNIPSNYTNINTTCPFSIKSVPEIGTIAELEQWNNCTNTDWECKKHKYRHDTCIKYTIPQICISHGYKKVKIITSQAITDSCRYLSSEYYKKLNDQEKASNYSGLLILSIILINPVLLFLLYKIIQNNSKQDKNIQQSKKILQQLIPDFKSPESRFLFDHHIKYKIILKYHPDNFPISYLLDTIIFDKKIKNTCAPIKNICSMLFEKYNHCINTNQENNLGPDLDQYLDPNLEPDLNHDNQFIALD